MIELPVETELFRTALSIHCGAIDDEGNISRLVSQANWPHFLWLGRQQRVLLFVQDLCKSGRWRKACPPGILTQLDTLREVSQLSALSHLREVCQVQRLFNEHNVRAIATDAITAAPVCGYRHDLVSPNVPLRFLVSPSDLGRASDLLANAGHSSRMNQATLIKSGSRPVDLNCEFGSATDFERIWSSVEKFNAGGVTHYRPTLVHWLTLRSALWHRRSISFANSYEIVCLWRRLAPADWPHTLTEINYFAPSGGLLHPIASAHDVLGLPRPAAFRDLNPTDETKISSHASSASVEKDPQAPFLPTPPLVVERMLKLADTCADDVVCDLGCGDGRIIVEAASTFGARGIGIDSDPVRVSEAKTLAATRAVQDRVSILCGDLFAAKISDASVVTCYLLPQVQSRLERKLRLEARPGTRVVSHEFTFPCWPPTSTEIIRTGPTRVSQIYLWHL